MSRTRSIWAAAATALLALVLGLLNPAAAFAGNDGMLNTALTAKNAAVYSGDALVYEAQLSCSDPAECTDVTLHFSKPAGVKSGAKGAVTKPYPPGVSSVTANEDGTVDVAYSATAAGLVSQLTISWPTENLTTLPGDQTTTMTVTQPGHPDVTREATIELLAGSAIELHKSGAATTLPDQAYTYTLAMGLSYLDPINHHGGLTFTDAVLVDPLPVGAVFVSASGGGVYDPQTRTVTWQIGNLGAGDERRVTVTFPAPADGGEAEYLNTATLSGLQLGASERTSVDSSSPVTVRADAPDYRVTASKSGTPVIADGVQHFEIVLTNRSNAAADIRVTDPIPDGLVVTSVDRGYYGASPGSTIEFGYADGTTSGPLDFDVPTVPVPAGAPRVATVTVVFHQLPVNRTASVYVYTVADWEAIGHSASLTNCATIETVATGDAQQQCARIEVSPVPVPSPGIAKSVDQTPVGPGGTMTWTLSITNSDNNPTPLMPIVYDNIPNQLEYVPGSLRLAAGAGDYCLPAADFHEELLAGWNADHGLQYDDRRAVTVRWTYTGSAGLVIPKWRAGCDYEYDTVVKPGVTSGSYTGYSSYASFRGNDATIFDRDHRIPASPYGWVNDLYDEDGDGDATEQAPRAAADFSVADSAAAWIEKHVTGDQDGGHWFDSAEKRGLQGEVGTSTPGGTVSYQVRLGNLGNRDLTKLVAYDLLPQPGNHGVTNGRYAQDPPGSGNEWTPTMTGPIPNPSPGSLTITYSTKADPCRPEMDNSDEHSASFFCDGQQDASWRTADQVGDWSQVRAIRFDFGDHVFAGGEFVDLEWTMAAPTALADGSPIRGGERTWNRIALDSVQAADGAPLLAAEAPWVVDRMAVPAAPTAPAISIEKWSTEDGFPLGDFDDAPGKSVTAKTATAITMTVTNTGAEALRDVTVTDETLDGPAMTGLSCDFSPLGGPASGTEWAGPFEVGASFDCTGEVPGLDAGAAHADRASVTGVGVDSGSVVRDADDWHARASKHVAPSAPFEGPDALAHTGIVLGAAGLAAGLLLLGLLLARRRRARA